ncbi:MAG: hypothetical protein ACPG5B_12230 [Chitinophagales bacterium]
MTFFVITSLRSNLHYAKTDETSFNFMPTACHSGQLRRFDLL